MPRYNNYSLVVGGSNFNPYQSLQEMLVPFTAYKDAYEKSEAAFEDLSDKSNKFKYLSETLPEGSKARQLYEGYANELDKQAQDLAKNGLSMGNRRALTNLKRRYQGEIGRLVDADAAMQEEKKLRRTMNAKDSSMLYATDNMSIDDFLDGNTPNLYSISGEDLRKEAAQYAQAASSRIYGNSQIENVNKYFQDIIQTQGYSPEALNAWRQNLESIPEFNQAIEDIMSARGVNGNLTGANYERARQNVINGIMEGSVYQEKRNTHQNPGVLTAAQAASNALGWANHNLHAAASGMVKDSSSPTGYRYDITQDPKAADNLWMYKVKDGKIVGYSDEYLKAVKNGDITPGGKANTKGSKDTKADELKPAPDPKVRYNSKGEMQEAKGTASNPLNYGTPISYADAISKYPNAAIKYDKDKYNFYVQGDWLYPVPKTAEELKSKGGTSSPSTSGGSTTGNGSNHNAL